MSVPDIGNLCFGCMEPVAGASLCPRCGWQQNAASDEYPLALPPGSVLSDRYLVGRVLGQGGFGITYLGWDSVLSRRKAIKECFPQGFAGRHKGTSHVFPVTPNARASLQRDVAGFLSEARLLASFENHPNIVWIQDFFSANGTAYMIIEYLHGKTLEDYVHSRGGRIPWDEAGRILMPVLDALREVHRVGILHRDVSPDNVFLLNTGQVKLIDFGAARNTASITTAGFSVILKHGYGPLEQYQQQGNQGPWTDVYAAAGTIYRAITGVTPPPAPERYQAESLRLPSALGISIPPAHERALLRALAVRVEDRFQDVTSFQQALLGRQSSPPGPNPAPGPVLQPVPPPPPLPQPTPIPTPLPAPLPSPAGFGLWKLAALAAALAVVATLVGLAAWRVLRGDPPEIARFESSAETVVRGRAVTLRWDVRNATEVEIEGLGKQSPTGSAEVTPEQTTNYRLVARNQQGTEAERVIPIAVTEPSRPQVVRFAVTPEEVDAGAKAILAWEVANAESVKINAVKVPLRGQVDLTATQSMRFAMEAVSSEGGTETREARLMVRQSESTNNSQSRGVPPVVLRFAFSKSRVAPGESTTLQWEVLGASKVQLQGINNISEVKAQGSLGVSFRRSGSVTLIATSATGLETRRTASVDVVANNSNFVPGALEILSYSVSPSSIRSGQSARLQWTTRGASYVMIGSSTQRFQPSGSVSVKPTKSGTFTLTAFSSDGRKASKVVSVQVAGEEPPVAKRWSVMHDLGGVLNFGSRNWNYQRGTLTLSAGRLRFETQNPRYNFDVSVGEIEEIDRNRLPIQGNPAFHIKLRSGGNYNFVPQSGVDAIVAEIRAAMRG